MRLMRWDFLLACLAVCLLAGDAAVIVVSEADTGSASLFEDFSRALDQLFVVIEVALFAVVGTIITRRHPNHPVGLSLLVTAVGLSGFVTFGDYATVALRSPDSILPAGELAATLASAIWPVILTGMFYLTLLFPAGQIHVIWLKRLARAWPVVATVVALPYFLAPGMLEPPFKDIRSPLAMDELTWLSTVAEAAAFILLVSALVGCIHAFVRFRHSQGVVREQFRWVAFAAILALIGTPLTAVEGIYTVASLIQFAGFAGFPVAVGLAITRYHLYEIDRILNRTLVYTALTVVLGATYFAAVVGLQELLSPLSGGTDLAIAVTTLLVAALFLPARQRIQHFVDRRFNRRAYDAERTIDAFSTRLREQVDLDTLRYELLTVVDETMQPSGASLWLRGITS